MTDMHCLFTVPYLCTLYLLHCQCIHCLLLLPKRQHVRLPVCLHCGVVCPLGGRREPHRVAAAHQVSVVRRGRGHAAVSIQDGRHDSLHGQPHPRLAIDEVSNSFGNTVQSAEWYYRDFV